MNHLTSRAYNKIILNVISSNTNEVIRAILNLFIFFFTRTFHTHKKHKKHKKPENYKKHKKRKKRKKRKKHKTPNKWLSSS